MQIKEFEAATLKECLQKVRDALGPDAVILETRKARKGGLFGLGAREVVQIVAAIGVTVKGDIPADRPEPVVNGSRETRPSKARHKEAPQPVVRQSEQDASTSLAAAAARAVYARNGSTRSERASATYSNPPHRANGTVVAERPQPAPPPEPPRPTQERRAEPVDDRRLATQLSSLKQAVQEVREGLVALQREQQEVHERTVTAVVSAVAPAVSAVSSFATTPNGLHDDLSVHQRFPELYQRLLDSGVRPELAGELLNELPGFEGWSPEARGPLAESTLKDLITRRIASGGPIQMNPGRLKAVALIGPTGVGKTTTIAKLAAHFSLVEQKRVGLLTVDTYRIAAVEQLKTYSQIIDIPIAVAYNQAEVLPAVQQFADFDLLLIDTAGRSQKNIMQVGELKAMLEMVDCETHLVLSAIIKEADMLDAARRFSAARVDRLLFTKLDETSTYGTLLNVADASGIPLSYMTTGQKVPEDIEVADGALLADLILNL